MVNINWTNVIKRTLQKLRTKTGKLGKIIRFSVWIHWCLLHYLLKLMTKQKCAMDNSDNGKYVQWTRGYFSSNSVHLKYNGEKQFWKTLILFFTNSDNSNNGWHNWFLSNVEVRGANPLHNWNPDGTFGYPKTWL